MTRIRQFINVCVAAVIAWPLVQAGPVVAGTVYGELYAEFTRHDHRLAGSTNFAASAAALQQTLRAAGLEPQNQTFETLVPETRHLQITVDGQELAPAYVVNPGIATMVDAEPFEGPAVWVEDGQLEALDGKDLEGVIAILDFDAPRVTIANLFPLGVRAVMLVGRGSGSQWRLDAVVQQGPTTIPLFYVDRDVAEAGGLLPAAGQQVRIEAEFVLRDASAENIWVILPGKAGRSFRLGGEEVVFVSAVLDTYGVVPGFSPDHRRAANAALLADVLCQIARQPRERTVVAVFFGSHYAAQEGARHFYYAASLRNVDPDSRESQEWRLERYRAELAAKENLLGAAGRDDIFAVSDEVTREYAGEIRVMLAAYVSNINAMLRDHRLAQNRLRGRHAAEMPAAVRQRLAQHEEQITALNAEKSVWNNLRQQLTDRQLAEDAVSREAFLQVRGEVQQMLLARQQELQASIRHVKTSIQLARAIGNRIITGHFDFDFARADRPWMLDMMGDVHLFADRRLDTGSFLMHLSEIGQAYESIHDPSWSAPLYVEATRPYYKPFSLSVPVQRTVPTAPAMLLGVAGFQLMTVGEPLDHDGLPVRTDTDLEGLREPMSAFLTAMGNAEQFSLRQPVIPSRMEDRLTYSYRGPRDYSGLHMITYARSSSELQGNARNAILAIRPTGIKPLAALNRAAITRINTDGYVFAPMISRGGATAGGITAYGYDNRGAMNRYSRAGVAIGSQRIPLFYGYGGAMFSYGFAPDLFRSDLYQARILDAESDAVPRMHFFGGLGNLSALYMDREVHFKRIGNFGELLLGSTRENPLGEGIPLDAVTMLHADGVQQGARDYWHLNESRLAVLRARNIISDPLEQLHADAGEHLEEAQRARAENLYSLARAHDIFATALENRVYAPLRGITDDLVRAVVVLLLLSIPFAFAMERLLCGFTIIYKQVLGFVGFFLLTFWLLYVTHPAFSLAQAPIVIFLAFVILLLGGITLYIVLSKIKQEIRAIQGLASSVHGVESDSSTAVAAVLIGISGMRNRPLKTFLTAITVVLLTFTILVFASFTAEVGVVEAYLGSGQDEDRIELNRFSYLDIPLPLVASIEQLSGRDFHVFRRGGLFMNPTRPEDQGSTPASPESILLNPRDGSAAGVGAVMGLDPRETRHLARLDELVPGFATRTWEHPAIYLPELVAERLNLVVGDSVQLTGRFFSYAGPISATMLRNLTTINNTRIVPPDFKSTMMNVSQGGAGALEEMDIGSFIWFSAEQVAITDIHVLQDWYPNVNINFLSMYPRSGDIDIEAAGRHLAPVFQGSVHIKTGEGAQRLFFSRAVEGSGLGDVIVPLLLGGLIIFSSLMGSIVDREREIFTYSALGLSPPSVGALFFAESAVYSVVGGMGGYLVSQVVAHILTFMGERGIFNPPDMNFSSLASVLTILIVMAVIMLSTIYPALKAGKSANPGVARKWKMPAPQGDRLDFVFPFTVSAADFAGILSFIKEHFENHGDATLGNFAAREVQLFRQTLASGKDSQGIEADISLAPFDLGIFQRFRMYSKEFEIKGIDEVVVELERVGGTTPAWVRGNRGFAAELRKQFLLWRSLPIETIEHYREQTANEIGG